MTMAPWKGNLLLLITALIWGISFVPQKTAMSHMPPLLFTGLRFMIGCVALYPFIKLLRRLDKRPVRSINLTEWKIGMLLGSVMFIGIALQQVGMVYTTVSKASFITGLYVVLVPLIGFFFGQRVGWIVVICAFIAFIGLYLLSIPPDFVFDSTAIGDVFVFISAFGWASHVIAISLLGHKGNALHLSFAQFLTTALLSFIAAYIWETPDYSAIALVWPELLFCGVMSVSIAFTLQVIGQRSAPASSAAIILSLEAVFAVLAGWLYLNEVITPRGLTGICLMFAAMLITQVAPYWQRNRQRRRKIVN